MRTDKEFLEALGSIIAIDSVAGIDASKEYPFGKKSGEALEKTLEICKSLGMRTVNRDGMVGWAEIGEGEEMVGILGHLDVVPAGEGWKYPPYEMTEEGDRIYGRGVTDDKGPVMASIFAMADLLEEKVPLKRRVRIIFGQSEESGEWTDMNWYKENEELPVFGFTPDADFPAIYGEKGILCFELKIPVEKLEIEAIEGGDASNVVPSWCRAQVKGVSYETTGKAAHASTPEEGKNAISEMMKQLAEVCPGDPLVGFYNKYIGSSLHGEQMGCALKDDKSGLLTMNAGTVRVKDGFLVMEIDVRNPVTHKTEEVLQPVKAAAEEFGFSVKLTEDSAPVYMDKEGKVIQKLLEVYRNAVDDMSEPAVIGGGTYARAMENIVAFGPMIPGRELTEHMPNEYILKEDLFLIRRIYREAILQLANL